VPQELKGKVALITGAARGIGEATARMLANSGACVVLGDLLPEVEQVAKDISAAGGKACALLGSVGDPEYCKSLAALATEEYGRLDIAFNNAGIGGKPGPIEDLAVEDWDNVIAINLNAVFYGIKYQIPEMLKNGGGHIINTSSVLGLKPIPQSSIEYTAAKHGVIGLTRQVAVNYGGEGIRCNAICPGFIDTPLVADHGSEWFVDRTPVGRAGTAKDIAGVVKMLCSDDTSFVNGASLQVDGGFVLT
jgi:NAD(P)-dependent dehydrogenase (short-subunit alcohol dehydrogenase family)